MVIESENLSKGYLVLSFLLLNEFTKAVLVIEFKLCMPNSCRLLQKGMLTRFF